MTELEFGPDHDWTGWQTPDDVVAPVATLAAPTDTDFTGRVARRRRLRHDLAGSAAI